MKVWLFYRLVIKALVFVGIKSNEKANSAAKSVLDLQMVTVGVPYLDFLI